MYTFVPHIETLYSAPWVGWILLFLLVCLYGMHISHPGMIRNVFTDIFSPMERRYSDSPKVFSTIFGVLFCVSIWALALSIGVYQGGTFSIVGWLRNMAVVAIALAYKALWIVILGWIYPHPRVFAPARAHHYSLWMSLSIVLYVVVAFLLILPNPYWIVWIMAGMLVFYIGILSWKLILAFRKNWLSVVYIVIYLLCCELLPIAGVGIAAWQITK